MQGKVLLPVFVAILASLTTAPFAQAVQYVTGQDAVDNDEIRWGGNTQYTWERTDAINTWNAENPINIAPDTIWTIQDLTFSDVNCSCYPWYGAYQQRSFDDALFLNIHSMSGLIYSERRHVMTHEMGHSLGLGHSITGNVMYTGTFQYTLGTQDRSDYHYLWGY